VLPNSGGARDQQAGELTRLSWIYAIWHSVYLWEHRGQVDDAKWVGNHPGEWDIVQDIWEFEKDDGIS
jgi:hypothetical protein